MSATDGDTELNAANTPWKGPDSRYGSLTYDGCGNFLIGSYLKIPFEYGVSMYSTPHGILYTQIPVYYSFIGTDSSPLSVSIFWGDSDNVAGAIPTTHSDVEWMKRGCFIDLELSAPDTNTYFSFGCYIYADMN